MQGMNWSKVACVLAGIAIVIALWSHFSSGQGQGQSSTTRSPGARSYPTLAIPTSVPIHSFDRAQYCQQQANAKAAGDLTVNMGICDNP